MSSTSKNDLFSSRDPKLWLVCKYLLLISLYLSSHLKNVDAFEEHQNCNEENFIKCKNGVCISKNFVCDGENDCGDFSDESNCKGAVESNINHGVDDGCDADSFQCLDNLCIPNHWVCDGNDDCTDSSDETYGCNNTVRCDDGFRCKSRACIPKEFVCDGDGDCEDNSDEENCPTFEPANCNINNKQFLCNDRKRCIKLNQVCDNKSHCLDESDEGGKCSSSKICQPICTNGHQCILTPLKSLCVCPEGHSDKDGFCRDIDECQEFGACDHKCKNTLGSFICSCSQGYKLQPDGHSCKIDGGEGLLLFSSEHEIRAYYLESTVYYPVSNNISHANGIAYDGHHVYWSNVDSGKESIVRANEDGSNIEVLVDFGLGTPENIVLDWITDNIYFTDSLKKHIGVCLQSGEHCMILHKDGIDNPRGIALDSNRGMLYWSDWGDSVHSIIKSGMDGSNRNDFVNKDIFWPNGITIDFGADRLYWADANKKIIESILLDGTDRRIIVSEPIDHPLSISVFENKLYWSDWKGNQILSCNKFNGKNHTVIVKKHNSLIYNLFIFHSAIHPTSVHNPCLLNKCSHICLLSPETQSTNHTTCGCPQDMELSSDKINCVMKNTTDVVFVAAGSTVYKINYNKIGKKNLEEHILDGIAVLGDVAYDSYSDSIILSDLYKHHITSFNRRTKTHTSIFESNDEVAVKMGHDPLTNNLYWIDGKTNSLKVMNLGNMQMTILIPSFGDDLPTDLELVPESGLLFVSLHNTKGLNHIDKYYMDGSSRIHFLEKGLIGPIVTLKYDSQLHRLFIADQGDGSIFSTGIDVMDKHLFRESLPAPVGLTIHGDYIFWVNYGLNKVYWANKYNPVDTSVTSINRKVDMMQLISLDKFEVINNTTCLVNNGGCSHLCLLRDKYQVCACPNGMVLDTTGHTCIIKLVCNEDQYKCFSGECIRKDLMCNLVQDCQSGEDETNCIKTTLAPPSLKPRKPACPLDYFFCIDGSGCVPQSSVCDSMNDCADSSDEMHCSNKKTCSSAQFTCLSGQCIPATFRCDDRIDCSDFTDEENCKSNTCNPMEDFRCKSGNCIPKTWECDDELDCPDSSDEHMLCEKKEVCKKGMFVCLNHKCVGEELKCDGFDDCGDNSDEIGCSREISNDIEDSSLDNKNIHLCNATHFTCSGLHSACIPLSARCNGSNECTYGEDEKECSECIFGFFECKIIKECVPEVWVCDGMSDCEDQSDEDISTCKHHENTKEPKPKNETIPCDGIECKDSKKCIPFFKVCDKIPDCEDRSDEMGLCDAGCDGAGCSQICRASPIGARCDCRDGYKLNADGRTCTDINECTDPKSCSQECHNTMGSFFCSCLTPYYQLRDDRRRCKATGEEMVFIYLTEKDIRLATESLSNVQVLHKFKNPTAVDGMDFNVEKGLLYWTSRYEGKVTKLVKANPTKLSFKTGFEDVGSIAVDWITGNVYIALGRNIIKICDADITICTKVYQGPLDCKISAIAVDPIQGILFWSEVRDSLGHSMTTLKKSLMTGRMVEDVLKTQNSIEAVSDLAYDVINKWLYFADPPSKTVGRVFHNGTKLELVLVAVEPPANIGLFEDHIYIAEKTAKQSLSSKSAKYGVIQKCPIQSRVFEECSYIKLLPSSSKAVVKRLRLAHQSLQIQAENFCKDMKCQGICVNSGKKAVCLCEQGMFAPPDGSCPKMLRIQETNVAHKENAPSSKAGIIVICLLLVLLTLCSILVAIKFNKIAIPDNIYGRASSKVKQLKSFKFKSFDNKSFQFDNLKNELTEELIPENEDCSQLRNF